MKNILSKPTKVLNWCLAFAVAFILLYDFWLFQIPEKITGGYKFGAIFYKVCFAFLTSYIFYFVNVHLKKKVDKVNLSPYLAKKTYFIIQRAKNLFSEIGNASGTVFQTPYPPKEEFIEACKKINPNSAAPMVTINRVPLNWIQYLYNQQIEVSGAIQKLFALMPHLESKHISLLNDIDESTFFKTIPIQASVPFRNTDLTAWAEEVFKYGQLVQSLEDYYKEKLMSFSPGYAQI